MCIWLGSDERLGAVDWAAELSGVNERSRFTTGFHERQRRASASTTSGMPSTTQFYGEGGKGRVEDRERVSGFEGRD